MAMVFPTSPTVGQVFTSGGRSWVWNGSAWDSPAGQPFIAPGMALLTNQTFTNQTSIIIDNVFSASYDSYKIMLSILGSAGANINLVLRSAGTDIATANYQCQNLQIRNTSVAGSRVTNQTSFFISAMRGGGLAVFTEITISKPFASRSTILTSNTVEPLDTISNQQDFGIYTPNTSATGFKISSNSMTGDLQVYGMRN